MKGGAHLPGTDWEGLRTRWNIENLSESPILPPGSEKIELRRDEQYGIEAKVSGTLNDFTAELLPESGEPGVIVPDHRIEGTSHSGIFRYDLEQCFVRRVSASSKGSFEAELKTSRVRRSTTSERGPQAGLTEFYLNAHKGDLLYPRTVKRERKETYHKEMSYPEEQTSLEGGGSLSVGGYAYVEMPDLGFVLEHAPEETSPNWSRNYTIEYREKWGGVPDTGTRTNIANAVSFVMGCPLISVGYTAFDEQRRIIEEVAVGPLSQANPVAVCRRAEQPPVLFSKGIPTDFFEEFLTRFVSHYLASHEELNLNDALWYYWLSEQLPLDAGLPMLATGVETLKKGWYASKKSKSRGVYMPKKVFDKLLEDELTAAREKLREVEYGDRIARRMSGAYNFGSNEGVQFFFEELGLPTGEAESSAMRARNSMVHGSSALLDTAKHQKMVDDTLAYRTLFNRVLLRMLGYEGNYIDYSARDWPERPLEEPASGRE